ncbi:hypothetical protein XELAEV_18035248mg [Xenopus laevis]|uniref:Uncharacterized protein n=1 Tax=Xenopus laevis TaxID=8355 RepID=A0A974HBX9_XENLA|nr:hypothetical protein XELAEV_18035248mg [Xenopus laevis]
MITQFKRNIKEEVANIKTEITALHNRVMKMELHNEQVESSLEAFITSNDAPNVFKARCNSGGPEVDEAANLTNLFKDLHRMTAFSTINLNCDYAEIIPDW